MLYWVILTGFYLWLGFTVGYFFRKWLETRYLPRVQAEGERVRRAHRAAPDAGDDGEGDA